MTNKNKFFHEFYTNDDILMVSQMDFLSFLNKDIEKITQNVEENKMLEQLRDTLLPKLMNGEIDLDNIDI